MKHSYTTTLSSLIVLCGLILPAQAQIDVSGTSSGEGILTLVTPPGGFVQDFSSEGHDSRFGLFTGHSTSDRDVTDPLHQVISNGKFTETFGDGMLFGTFTGTAALTGVGTGTFESMLVFTGGTGEFSTATGNALVTGTFLRTSPTTFTAESSYTGVLTFVPEPGTLAFLVSISFSCGALLRSRRRAKGTPERL